MDINHRAKIENALGTYEFEGSKEFVESQVKALTDLLKNSPSPPPASPTPKGGAKEVTDTGPKPKNSNAPTTRGKVEAPKLLSKLIDDVAPLSKFVTEKEPKSQPEIYATIATWMKQNIGLEEFSIDEMFTAYRLLKKKEPKAMTQVFRDAKAKGLWFDQAEEKGKFVLTRHGESMVDHDLPRSKPKS